MSKTESTKISKIYMMPLGFFEDEGFKKRLGREIHLFRNKIETVEREEVKEELNIFFVACMSYIKDDDLKLEFQMVMLDLLVEYAKKHNNKQTLDNVLKHLNKKGFKEIFYSKYPFQAKYLEATVHYTYFNIEYDRAKQHFSKSNALRLLKAKYLLLKIYSHYIDGKLKVTDGQLANCLVLLSACLSMLHRWFEPNYYLRLAQSIQDDNPNISYIYARNLASIMDRSCLNFNGLLLLEIVEHSQRAIKSKFIHELQKQQLIEVKNKASELLKEQDDSIPKLRKHKKTVSNKAKAKWNQYKIFCSEKMLFLNEHSFFCACDSSTIDNLEVETSHEHTKIKWVEKFIPTVDVIVFDFIKARTDFYRSKDEVSLVGYYARDIKRKNSTEGIKSSLLKNSFRLCYSILDQIAHGILDVMDVNYDKILLEKYKEKSKIPKLYFLGMWDEPLFTDDDFDRNWYLASLWSIAKDLDRTDYSALSDFKLIRNAIEHKILFITNEPPKGKNKKNYFAKDDLSNKTELLLLLTKAAIFSFNNLIREQSKAKDPNHSKNNNEKG